MNQLLSAFFKKRGYTQDLLDSYCISDGLFPAGTERLCHKLQQYHDGKKHLVLLTDIDMDGIMSGVIGFAGLSELGFRVSLYMPSVGGYGFTPETIDHLVSLYPDVDGILTADVGITCHDGVAHARSLGLDIFVTDHHVPPAKPVDANVIEDPMSESDPKYGHICGANVLYQVLLCYALTYSGSNFLVSQIRRLRIFAGYGTVSDSMPMLYENRDAVSDAVTITRLILYGKDCDFVRYLPGCDVYRRAFYGIYRFVSYLCREKGILVPSGIDEEFIGYYIAPAFNAVKRVGDDMCLAYDVFFGTDPMQASVDLYRLNEKRKCVVADAFEDMMSERQPWAPYVYVTTAGGGILGLLAQNVMKRTGCPAFVVNFSGTGFSGSGRCPSWFPFLNISSEYNLSCRAAGHNEAFGIFFSDDSAVDDLYAFLQTEVSKRRPVALSFDPDILISNYGDGDVPLDVDLFADFLEQLELYKPFGPGFEKPVIGFRFHGADGVWSVMGKEKNHVRIEFDQDFSCICWNSRAIYDEWNECDHDRVYTVAGMLSVNEFRGIRRIQFIGSFV